MITTAVVNGALVYRKFSREVIVQHVDAYLPGSLFRVSVFHFQVSHEKIDILPDSFVIGLEGFRRIVFDGAPEIVIFQKWIHDLFLEIVYIPLMQ